MTDTRTAKCQCPVCRYQITAASGAYSDDAVPKGGDFTVCFGCGSVLVFRDDLSVRMPEGREFFNACDEDPAWAEMVLRVQAVIRKVQTGAEVQ